MAHACNDAALALAPPSRLLCFVRSPYAVESDAARNDPIRCVQTVIRACSHRACEVRSWSEYLIEGVTWNFGLHDDVHAIR